MTSLSSPIGPTMKTGRRLPTNCLDSCDMNGLSIMSAFEDMRLRMKEDVNFDREFDDSRAVRHFPVMFILKKPFIRCNTTSAAPLSGRA
jgi:hypothetical protein